MVLSEPTPISFPRKTPPIALGGRMAAAQDSTSQSVQFDLGGGRWVQGWGPFHCMAQPPVGAWAFYVNDFSLSNSKPWLIPDRLEFQCQGGSLEAGNLDVDWQEPERKPYEKVFTQLMQKVASGEIKKAVPAVVARAAWSDAMTEEFLHRLTHRSGDMGTYAYAFQDGSSGFAGRTPELLFRVEDGVLRTMALAGTAPTQEADKLLQNPKLLREHDLVVEVMRERLAGLGDLHVESRRLMPLGVMTHLCTRMEVTLRDSSWEHHSNKLISLLHPTPALGIAPRTPQTLALLNQCREKLGVPSEFGAPMGVKWPGGMQMLVAIRGVFWQDGQAFLPTGGGLVHGSDLDEEWAELELKRRWVRRALKV